MLTQRDVLEATVEIVKTIVGNNNVDYSKTENIDTLKYTIESIKASIEYSFKVD